MRQATLRTIMVVMLCPAFASARAAVPADPLVDGKYGKAISLKGSRKMILPVGDMSRTFPLTFEFWCRIDSTVSYNILLSQAPKYGAHWEIFTAPGGGAITAYVPQISTTDNFGGGDSVADGKWHYIALRFHERSLEIYTDGKLAVRKETKSPLVFDESPLYLGGIASDAFACDGAIDELHISRRADDLAGAVPTGPAQATPTSVHLFHFDRVVNGTIPDDAPGSTSVG